MSSIVAAAALALAAAPSPTTPEAAVAAIYAPYSGPEDATASWDYPIFSKQTSALIARWRRVAPQDEPDALSDGDWLCLCQEFDRGKFGAQVVSRRALGSSLVELAVRLTLGFGTTRNARLLFRRDGGVWKLDDLFAAPDFPRGLKQKLRETIVEDMTP
jgi:hypothetical protein